VNDSHESSTLVFSDGFPADIHASELSGGASSNGVLAAPPLAMTAYASFVHSDR
jgi:hypothetical protein